MSLTGTEGVSEGYRGRHWDSQRSSLPPPVPSCTLPCPPPPSVPLQHHQLLLVNARPHSHHEALAA